MAIQISPYLMMDGNAKEAIKFYQDVFDAQVLFSQTFGEAPEDPNYPMPAEAKDLIMHAMIKVGETDVMFSDIMPGQPFQSGNQVTLCISSDSKEKSEQMFNGLKDGGQVHMPLQETFFSPLYGIVTDKFGVTFQIYTEAPSLNDLPKNHEPIYNPIS